MRIVSVLAVFFLLVVFNGSLARASSDIPISELSREHEQNPSNLHHEARNTFLFPLFERPQQPDATSLYIALSEDPSSKAAQKNLEQRLDRIEQKLDGQTSTETRINDAMRRIDEQANRNVSFLSAGFNALAVFAAILALAGIGIAFFTNRLSVNSFKLQQQELESIVNRAKDADRTLSALMNKHIPSEVFSPDVLAKAKETIKNGTGVEMLQANAVLAQQQSRWQDALAYWQGVLKIFPQDSNALFGASLASLELAEKATGEEQQKYFRLGEEYFQKIPQDQLSSATLNNWGNLCMERGNVATSQEEREEWFAQAWEKYEHATRENPGHADSWCNWGTLCMELGQAATSQEERKKWFALAGEKYERAARENPGHAKSWCNWGNLCMELGQAATSQEEREEWFAQAGEKYERAARENPGDADIWFNRACLLSLRGDPSQCVAYLE
ncbi:MAG: tetratricopeptide repeat protein, partial [Desulfovibrio fairfieldensis]|nr:tetratricopeptide repeat protein [Desulfovibrio fairfieldensis]